MRWPDKDFLLLTSGLAVVACLRYGYHCLSLINAVGCGLEDPQQSFFSPTQMLKKDRFSFFLADILNKNFFYCNCLCVLIFCLFTLIIFFFFR